MWPRSQRGSAQAGVAPGDRVALLAPEPPGFIAAAYACWAIGAVAVVVDRGLGFKGLRRALRSAEPRWLVGTRKTLGAARALRWAPDARPLDLASLSARRRQALGRRRAPRPGAERSPRSSSRRARPARPRACSTTSGRWRRSTPPCASATRSAPTTASSPPLRRSRSTGRRSGSRLPCRIGHHQARSLGAEALADACAAVEATVVFAAPAALDGVLASRETLTPRGEGARRAPARPLCGRAGAAADARGVRRSRSGRRAPHAIRHDRGALGGGHRSPGAGSPRAGRGVCVGLPLARVGLRIEPLPGATASAGRSSARRGCRAATTDSGRPTTAPGPSTATASSGIARETSATSTTWGGSGSKDGSRTSWRQPKGR